MNQTIQHTFFQPDKVRKSVMDSIAQDNTSLRSLAKKITWSPISDSSSNFKTSYLKAISPTRLEVKNSTSTWVFSAAFICLGLIPMCAAITMMSQGNGGWSILFLTVFSLFFLGVGILIPYNLKPHIFDKSHGWFWQGNKNLNQEQAFQQLEQAARLSEIAAIQIVSGQSDSDEYWEINLISNEGQRLNVMSHGAKRYILEDAQKLGDFLDVPVWKHI